MLEAQKTAVWNRQLQPVLYGKTLCILGLGSIAETLTLYASTMGMTITGVSDGRESAPGVDRIYKRADLPAAAAEADFLVVLVPLSGATRYIVDAEVLLAMKREAFLINLARGGCVDEAALIEALEAGEIAGAGIDVFEREPLPPDDPLWKAPNVILTPHVGGFADIYAQQCLPTVVANLKIYSESGAGALETALERK
jgi:D-2-hydroxyacid dehydrogenase (NADP+)